MKLHSLNDLPNVKGKIVLVRVDVNVPIDQGVIQDDFRIQAALPTLRYLMRRGATVVIVGHLGRPDGVFASQWSLAPVKKIMEKKLRKTILLINQYESGKPDWNIVYRAVRAVPAGSLVMLENIRCSPHEEEIEGSVAKGLAQCADYFVMDGFGVAHRNSASVTGVARLLPSYAGLLLEHEVVVLDGVMRRPKRPCMLVLGGAKTETKIPVLRHFIRRADRILLGGEMITAYRYARGYSVGASVVDKKLAQQLVMIIKKGRVIIPPDVLVGDEEGKYVRVIQVEDKEAIILPNEKIFDIGPQARVLFARELAQAKTIIWNGALGKFEVRAYRGGTARLIAAIKECNKKGAYIVVGGGETVEIVRSHHAVKSCALVSSGGGAMLEALSGAILPGVAVVARS